MAKAPPSFDFYYNDFIAGTRHLGLVERACYLELLIFQWQNGSLPQSSRQMMNLCGVYGQSEWDEIWQHISDKFDEIDGKLVNRRMYEDRTESIEKWTKRKQAAAKARKHKGKQKPEANIENNVDPNTENNTENNIENNVDPNVGMGRGKIESNYLVSSYSSISSVLEKFDEKTRSSFVEWTTWRASQMNRLELDGITLQKVAEAFFRQLQSSSSDHIRACVDNAINKNCRDNVPWWTIRADVKSTEEQQKNELREIWDRAY